MKLAISIGDLNGVGVEIALRSHSTIKEICNPIYIVDKKLLDQVSKLLDINIPKDFQTCSIGDDFKITPSKPTKESGLYSYKSFLQACKLADKREVEAIVTLPINKEAWSMANIRFKGHTDLLAELYKKEAIMMIGSSKLFTALYTHHIPLKDIPKRIKTNPLKEFLTTLFNEIKEEKIAVLALNPHAGENGVIGDEESIIKEAINKANRELGDEIFIGPIVPDTAFTPNMLKEFQYYVAMYHDQGLIAVKSLFFDESINVSLNLPIIRTSVDHGTAYDIAYKNKNPSNKSYLNAVKEAIKLAKKRSFII